MSAQYLAALVCHESLTKRDALRQLRASLGYALRNADSANPVLTLSSSSWLTIEIPKFGEAPPLTLDVWSSESRDDAEAHALELSSQIAENLGWHVVPDFEAR